MNNILPEEITKKNYIVKQLARTSGKKFESYCVTGIYHGLKNSDIQIITQQMFRRKEDGKIALLDLFFPQLRIAVEVDEGHHLSQTAEDELRTKEINKMISHKRNRFDRIEGGEIEIIRIKVDDEHTIDDINRQIDGVIERINKRVMSDIHFKPWRIVERPVEEYKEAGYIDAREDVKIRKIVDILKLFGKDYKQIQRGFLVLDKDKKIYFWAPKLEIEEGIDFKNNKFINTIDKDGQFIYEISKWRPKTFVKEAINEPDAIRYVFPKYVTELGDLTHRFVGVYKIDIERSRKLKKRVWVKIGERVEL